MSPESLSAVSIRVAPIVGDHLWQSTFVAVVAGTLAFLLRKSRAQVRYWLWLSASMKFLIPFALLVDVGRRLAWTQAPIETKAGLYFIIKEVGQPFTHQPLEIHSTVLPTAVSPSSFHLLPALAATVWLIGFAAVVLTRYLLWQRMSAALRQAVPLREGREVQALRRLERLSGVPRPTEMLLSSASLEPGIFGIFQPRLVWPRGISVRLTDGHLNAVLTHELRHIRRRDNLISTLHMMVEAIFWFHPLVWWLGEKLVEERERTCDEEVVELGHERQVYAESILKVCEFCVESPLACVSGVTGADLKRRVANIMTAPILKPLNVARKMLLSSAGLAVVAVPIWFGVVKPNPIRAQSVANDTAGAAPEYQITSIKSAQPGDLVSIFFRPDQFAATNVTLQMLIREAYGIQDGQISGGPEWLTTDKYDIHAKLDKSPVEPIVRFNESVPPEIPGRMLQALLADRFKLVFHRETRSLPVYALIVGENGAKLQPSTVASRQSSPNAGYSGSKAEGRKAFVGPGQFRGQGVPLAVLVSFLGKQLGRTVLDRTGLTGNYDLTLEWPADENRASFLGKTQDASQAPESSTDSSLFTSVQEQLGLKLVPQIAPLEVLVIDQVERPVDN
jgi:bla regulator protein blaR1